VLRRPRSGAGDLDAPRERPRRGDRRLHHRAEDLFGFFHRLDGKVHNETLAKLRDIAKGLAETNGLAFANGSVELESRRWPFCFDPDPKNPGSTRSILPFADFNEELNRLTLVVKDLKAPKAKVTWGERNEGVHAGTARNRRQSRGRVLRDALRRVVPESSPKTRRRTRISPPPSRRSARRSPRNTPNTTPPPASASSR
jgi:hypothetical protein